MKKIIILIGLFFSYQAVIAQTGAKFFVKDNRGGKKLNPIQFSQSSKVFEPDAIKDIVVSKFERQSDSTYSILIENISKPILLQYGGIGVPTVAVIVSPNDFLNITIDSIPKNKFSAQVKFQGKNTFNYNYSSFFLQLNNKINYPDSIKNYSDLFSYLENLSKQEERKIDAHFAGNEKALMYTIIKRINTVNIIPNLASGIAKFKLKLTDNDYSHFTTFLKQCQSFQDDYMLNTNVYVYPMKSALSILNKRESKNDEFISNTKTIAQHFQGNLKDLLLASKFYSFSRYKTITPEDLAMLNKWYLENRNKLANEAYNKFIDVAYSITNVIKKPWPNEILNIKLYDYNNQAVSFKELLAKYKNAPIVLDHWATWCGPCIDEFTNGKEVVSLLKTKGLQFVYISIDKKNAINQMNKLITQYQLDSYRMEEKDYVVYSNYLNLRSIPRYILLNEKDGYVLNIDLPKPSTNSEFRGVLNQTLVP